MPLKSIIPRKSDLAIIGGVFKAVLNNPTIGKYDFTKYAVSGNRYNVAVDLGLKMNPSFLYFFHQLNFSLSIDEGVYLRAIDPGTVPELKIRDSTTNKMIFHAPFRLFRYFENGAADSFHFNMNLNSSLIADFQGLLIQTAELIGVPEIYAQCSFSVYEISDPGYIAEYKEDKRKRSF
jgi:hypothetical protein